MGSACGGSSDDGADLEITTLDDGPGGGFSELEADSCSDRAKWIYLVARDTSAGTGTLIRFLPDEERFEEVGPVNCPATNNGLPYSMAVDRFAIAWVSHDVGGRAELFRVSTTDGTCDPQKQDITDDTFRLFGMGFVSDGTESDPETGAALVDAETLYVGGGPAGDKGNAPGTLGAVNDAVTSVASVGEVPGWPELTGTGNGELWGFFPQTFDEPFISKGAAIQQINRETGEPIQNFDLEELDDLNPRAWAFAHWGGKFYVFLQQRFQDSSSVWVLDPEDGSFRSVIEQTGYQIVGAGVSTCAPTLVLE